MRHIASLVGAAAFAVLSGSADASEYALSATEITIQDFQTAAPLFTTKTIGGTITLSSNIAPGDPFNSGDVTALSLNFLRHPNYASRRSGRLSAGPGSADGDVVG